MTEPLTTQQHDEITTRLNAATPGPWTLSIDFSDILSPSGDQIAGYWKTADGEFIAHAPEDIRALLAEVQHLRQRVALLLKAISCTGDGAQALVELLAADPDDAGETHVVADSSDDPEHTEDCPGCETAAARPAATTQDGGQ